MADFGQQVAAHAERYKKRMRAVAKESVQKTVEIMQQPTGDGGRMRVETSFLRASLAANIGSMPSGESENLGGAFSYDGTAVAVALLKWNPELGEVFYLGYVANYARPREAKDGFLRGAVELWPRTVNEVAQKVKALI